VRWIGRIYGVTNREGSMKILETKIPAIDQTAPDRAITSNPGCFMQLVYGRKRWDQKRSVLHISQILSEPLKRGEQVNT
jgi:Fe-S oxidoreductase